MSEDTHNTAPVVDELIERMFKVGAHFGYSKSRRHPTAKPFIFGAKNKVEIFDLEKTKETLGKAVGFVEELGKNRKVIAFISGKREAQVAVQQAASALSMPFVAGRWIGGTFTNFGEIRKRVDKFLDLLQKREKGELSKYTKKERLLIDREIDNLNIMFSGIVSMKKLPDAVFIVDADYESIAVTEARKARVPVISLVNSDCDISLVDYPIVANDASLSSIKFFIEEIAHAYKKGLKSALPIAKVEAPAVTK
jgi:small subunit ribosomal protein S2